MEKKNHFNKFEEVDPGMVLNHIRKLLFKRKLDGITYLGISKLYDNNLHIGVLSDDDRLELINTVPTWCLKKIQIKVTGNMPKMQYFSLEELEKTNET